MLVRIPRSPRGPHLRDVQPRPGVGVALDVAPQHFLETGERVAAVHHLGQIVEVGDDPIRRQSAFHLLQQLSCALRPVTFDEYT